MNRFSLHLSAMLAVATLAACGGAPPASTPAPQATAATGSSAGPTATPRPAQPTATARPPATPTSPPVTSAAYDPAFSLPTFTPAAGKGALQGRVNWNGKGAPNLKVRLCDDVSSFSSCKGKVYEGLTNASGDYRFENVDPGEYGLTVKVFETNDWLYITSGILSAKKYAVEAAKVASVGTQNIFKTDLQPDAPKANAQVTELRPALKWKTYADAAYYQVYLSGKQGEALLVNARTEEPTIAIPRDLLDCEYNYKVEAFNANRFKIAEFTDSIKFTGKTGKGPCELKPTYPNLMNETLSADKAANLTLEWPVHPLGASYKVVLYDQDKSSAPKILDFAPLRENNARVGKPLPPGKYIWWAQVIDADGKHIAGTTPVTFLVK